MKGNTRVEAHADGEQEAGEVIKIRNTHKGREEIKGKEMGRRRNNNKCVGQICTDFTDALKNMKHEFGIPKLPRYSYLPEPRVVTKASHIKRHSSFRFCLEQYEHFSIYNESNQSVLVGIQ